MQRNRAEQERKLISAVDSLLKEEGYSQLKINKIAQKAGVNKVLIYRYFGNLDGLLQAYFNQKPPVIISPPIDVERLKDAPLDDFFQTCYTYLIDEFRLLRKNVVAQEFLKANLFSHPGGSSSISEEKDRQFRQMIDQLNDIIGSKNGRAFSALLVSGLTLLTFAGQQEKVIFGIDLKTDEGWAQVESALANIFRGAYLYTKERLAAEGRLPTQETA